MIRRGGTTAFLVKAARDRLREATRQQAADCWESAVSVEQVLGVNMLESGKSFSKLGNRRSTRSGPSSAQELVRELVYTTRPALISMYLRYIGQPEPQGASSHEPIGDSSKKMNIYWFHNTFPIFLNACQPRLEKRMLRFERYG